MKNNTPPVFLYIATSATVYTCIRNIITKKTRWTSVWIFNRRHHSAFGAIFNVVIFTVIVIVFQYVSRAVYLQLPRWLLISLFICYTSYLCPYVCLYPLTTTYIPRFKFAYTNILYIHLHSLYILHITEWDAFQCSFVCLNFVFQPPTP